MFDMLDDDTDLAYIPTAPGTKSRAGSMKKLTKKEPKAPKSVKPNPTKISQFDDLLDDILEKQTKALGNLPDNNPSIKNQMTKKDSFDSYFDDPKPKSPKKSQITSQEESKFSSFGKKANPMEHSDEIISEDFGFGKSKLNPNVTGPTIPPSNPIKRGNTAKEEINDDLPVFTSTRNVMKPPLKKKDSQGSLQLPPSNSPTLTMPEEINLTLSSNKNDEIIKPPPRLIDRKPSGEDKSEKNDFSINTNLKSQSLILVPEKKDIKKEENSRAGRGLYLTLDEPKIEKREQKTNTFSFVKEAPEKVASKELKLFQRQSKSLEKPKQELKLAPPPRVGLQMKIDQSVTWKQTPPVSNITAKPLASNQDYQGQIQHIKRTFQKQIDFMQENLQRQISANRQTRQKIIQQSNKMIEDERMRSKKMFQEELTRQKDMLEWEKKRLEDHYQAEIAGLKQSLDFANRNTQMSTLQQSKTQREDSNYLEMQLKNQKKILDDRERIIDKREADLDERENQFARRRKREEDRLRDEEKRLMELEMKLKKQSMDQKKILAQEKQEMAVQLANLELEVMRKKEKADYSLKENRLAKESVDNERAELRMANAELMSKYRAKCTELQQERERIQLIEQELIKKLRVVELKNREVSAVNRTMCQKKENNWVTDSRPMSVGRRTEKPVGEGNRTRDRFAQLQSKTKERLNISVRENGNKFDLDRYMMTVDNYNKLRLHA